MEHNSKFSWEYFINFVNYISCKNTESSFTNLEQELLRCYWNNLSDSDTLKVLEEKRLKLGYYFDSSYFLSLGFKPNVMKKLSRLIGRPVNKNNFKQVFEHIWERGKRANLGQDRSA